MRPLTAIERVHLTHVLEMLREREAALQQQASLRARHGRIAATAVGLVVLLIGAALWLPTSWSLERNGAAPTVAERRTGQVRSVVRGDTCQNLHFSNERGGFVAGEIMPCPPESPATTQLSSGSRMHSIRNAFAR
jgi:hypothetical protein